MDKQALGFQASSDSLSDSLQSVADRARWKDFVQLTKPGILRSNLIAAFGGYWLASQWHINWLLFIYMLIGTTLVMASSCVFNNYLDRELDRKMERTSDRPLPAGRLRPGQVLWYGIVLGLAGLAVLLLLVNALAALLGLIGMLVYVVVYTAWLKRTSTLSTVMGSFAGSMPPAIGYVAITGRMDAGAWLLFALLFFWQPPHFWALGIRRKEEYRAAGFMILPVVKGVKRTKLQMVPYVFLLLPSSVLLYTYGYVGVVFLICSLALGAAWLLLTMKGFRTKDDEAWAKKNFIFSVNYLMIIFLIMVLDTARL